MQQDLLKVIVAGQLPPPVGGQNLVIQRIVDLLEESEDIQPHHWKFEFTKTWSQARHPGFWKGMELIRVIGRFIRLSIYGRYDTVIFPTGGPHVVPILRDILLLPLARLLSKRVILHFQAAGISSRLDSLPSWITSLAKFTYSTYGTEAWVLTEFGREDPVAMGVKKVRVLPNCFDPLFLQNSPAPNSAKTVILSVGHLCPDKGTPELIQAFAQLAKDNPALELHLVGECLPPYHKDQLAKDLRLSGVESQIILSGVLAGEDLKAKYQQANLFVFATVAPYESFGLVLVEAMQTGLPIVLTNWRANLEVATKSFGGVVAEKGQLTKALHSALSQKEHWQTWGKENHHIAMERYSPDVFQVNLLKLLLP